MADKSKTEEFKTEIRVRCPFCEGTADIGMQGVMHTLPTCKVFEELGADDYVHEVHEFIMKTADPKAQRS